MGRRGNKKHLKRLAAPSQWMLDKLSGVWAPRPSTGPHKLRECLPLVLILRNRLKLALTANEVKMILMNKLVQVDGKIRRDTKYPVGFMDIVTIKRIDKHYRLMYDVKGRFKLVEIEDSEAHFKLCKVVKAQLGRGGVPYIATHNGRTIRYPDPDIHVGDTIKFNLRTGRIEEFYKFQPGAQVMVVKGRNTGRVGTIRKVEKHPGSHNIAHVVDVREHKFATRAANIFVISEGSVTLPRGGGCKLSIIEERNAREEREAHAKFRR